MRYTVVCSQRNEGPYLVEWVAWQRMLGFTDIVVVSNDCTDRSPGLLDALERAGWVTHLRRDVPEGRRITARKLAAAHAHPVVKASDWVMVCDVDEFLVVHDGDGTVGALIGDAPASFLGMAVNWRVFGSGGRVRWKDGLSHRQFIHAAEAGDPSGQWFKSIAAEPALFGRLAEHGPRDLAPSATAGAWGQGRLRWVNSEGRTIPEWQPGLPYLRRLAPELVTIRRAQINHYMVRTPEAFSLKRGTLSPVGRRDRYTNGYVRAHDRNEVEDRSALRYRARFGPLHGAAMALPEVSRLHHLCCADYVTRLATKAGRDPAADPRLAHHLALAAD